MSSKYKIGILGGSFNPAHKGHLAISKEAKKFKLKDMGDNIKKSIKENKTSLSIRIKTCKKIIKSKNYIKVKFYEKKLGQIKQLI